MTANTSCSALQAGNMVADELIQEIVSRLTEAAPGSTIILFGSQARGDARRDSDLDILVVEQEVRARRREMVRLSDVLRPLRVPIDIVVVSQRNFDEWRDLPGTIIHRAASEGRVLHARMVQKPHPGEIQVASIRDGTHPHQKAR